MSSPAEKSEKPLSLRDRLLSQIPEGFFHRLGDLRETGIYGDHMNSFTPLTGQIETIRKKNVVEKETALGFIRDQLGRAQTYTEYIQDVADYYNERAQTEGKEPLDIEKMVRICVAEVPNAVEIDKLAIELKSYNGPDMEGHFDRMLEVVQLIRELTTGQSREEHLKHLQRMGLAL